MTPENVVRLNSAKCPICGRPRQPEYRPFCSKRCADVDLGRWFGEVYAVPVEFDPDEDEGQIGESGPEPDDDRYL